MKKLTRLIAVGISLAAAAACSSGSRENDAQTLEQAHVIPIDLAVEGTCARESDCESSVVCSVARCVAGQCVLNPLLNCGGDPDTGLVSSLGIDVELDGQDDPNPLIEVDVSGGDDTELLDIDLLGGGDDTELVDVDLLGGGDDTELVDVDLPGGDGGIELGIGEGGEPLLGGLIDELLGCEVSTECGDDEFCSLDVCLATDLVCSHAEVPGCCEIDADCTSSNPCAVGTCSENVCGFAIDPDCDDGDDSDSSDPHLGVGCESESDCNDDDECTLDVCAEPLKLCAHVPLLTCGEGDDTMSGDGDGDDMMGGDGDGTMSGDGDGDSMMGGDGDGDSMMGGDGDDTASGDGDDTATNAPDATGSEQEGIYEFGGGACSYGSPTGAASSWLWVALGLALFFLRRERKWLLAGAASTIAMSPAPASAQGFAVDNNRVPLAPEDLLWTEHPAVPMDHLSVFGRAMFGYANNPLVRRETQTGEETKIIDAQYSLYLNAGVALLDRFHLAAMVPIYGNTNSEESSPIDAQGLGMGNPDLDARVVILPQGKLIEWSAGADLRLPWGDSARLLADDKVAGGVRTSVGRSFGKGMNSFVALNLGLNFREETTLGNVQAGDEITFGVGANYAFWGPLAAIAEFSGKTTIADAFAKDSTPLGLMLGLRFAPRGWSVAAGAGPGLGQGYGSPDLRVLATGGARLNMKEPKKEPRPSEASAPENQPRAEATSQPPAVPLNDDADGDGILSDSDQCPTQAEDKDGFEDSDGCPDLDNDRDGVGDAADQCVDDAETMNGIEDEDGCPDMVRVVQGQIMTLEPIFFEYNSAKIERRSEPMLSEMARVILDREELGVVSIEGHTDAKGGSEYNRQLSQSRAEAVRAFLIQYGVLAGRVTAIGYGEERPLAEGVGAGADARNRRVEFRFADLGANTGAE